MPGCSTSPTPRAGPARPPTRRWPRRPKCCPSSPSPRATRTWSQAHHGRRGHGWQSDTTKQQAVHRLYDVRGVPSALLIDRRGVVRHAATGSRSITEVLAAWNESEGGRGMMDRNALKPLLAGGALALGLIVGPGDRRTARGPGLFSPPCSCAWSGMKGPPCSPGARLPPASSFQDAAGERTVSLEDLKGESVGRRVRQLLLSVQPPAYAHRPGRGTARPGQTHAVHPTRGRHRPGADAGRGRAAGRTVATQFPVLVDADGSTFDAYQTSGVPTTYLLDAEGKVAGFRRRGAGGSQAGTGPWSPTPSGGQGSR